MLTALMRMGAPIQLKYVYLVDKSGHLHTAQVLWTRVKLLTCTQTEGNAQFGVATRTPRHMIPAQPTWRRPSNTGPSELGVPRRGSNNDQPSLYLPYTL
jgi:hypothetical protein